MAKITVVPCYPSICHYEEDDELIFFVGTFEQAKKKAIELMQAEIAKLENLHYKDWKKREREVPF